MVELQTFALKAVPNPLEIRRIFNADGESVVVAASEGSPADASSSAVGSPTGGHEVDDLAFATLAILSEQEFSLAHEFANAVLQVFVGLLPFGDAVSVLTTACQRLRIRPPVLVSHIPKKERGLKLLKIPIRSLSMQLLRQFDEMELVSLMERWNAAALVREKKTLERHQEHNATLLKGIPTEEPKGHHTSPPSKKQR